MPRVLVSASNDLSNDQRVHKVCSSLEKEGWEVLLIGRLRSDSAPLERSYATRRLRLWFDKGFAFYAELNFRLFWILLFERVDAYHPNDLDTLLPNFLSAGLRRKPLTYDTHEYFLGVPELQNRPRVRAVWAAIERWIFPRLESVFTVNESIAALYEEDYRVRPAVMRNIPPSQTGPIERASRAEWGLSQTGYLLINQGTGINVDRGMEELLEALVLLTSDVHLLLVGKGDVLPSLKERAKRLGLEHRVHFIPPQPYERMMQLTRMADLGVSLDKDTNINYRFSLPNKLFDYIRAGLPVLVSDLPEVGKVVREYSIGSIVEDHRPETLARAIEHMRAHGKRPYVEALERASAQLHWESEVEPMLDRYRALQQRFTA
ncbi:glycosyltransferase [bacterium]|nr:glycosyltransferase [bacterium]